MWEDPHDVKSWRAFWALPTDCGPYRARPEVSLLDPSTFDDLAEWDAYWTAWHEWRCSVLEARYELGIHYDHREADRRVNFFRALKPSKGKWDSPYLRLIAWEEQQVVRTMYGYQRGDGTRLFRDIFVFVPKKQGKGDLAGGVVLDQLFLEGEPGTEVYGAAKNSIQARIVYERAYAMVKTCPALARRAKLLDSTKTIVVPDPHGADGYYKVLSADAGSQEGPSMQCLVADEVHVIPAKLLDVLTDGSGAARRQPIKFYTTTAGEDFSMPWYALLEFAKGVEDGVVSAADFLPVLYMVREDEGEDWQDEASWYKANPSLGTLINIEEMRSEYAKALAMPNKKASFKRRRLNIPVADGATRYLPMDAWDKCGPTGDVRMLAQIRDKMLEDMKGQQAVGWLDLSSRIDLTTFGLLFKRPDGTYVPIPWFFIPKENLQKRSARDRAHYQDWADHGFLVLTDGDCVDQRVVREHINAVRADYIFREIAYDDFDAGKIAIELQDEDGFVMVPITQNIKQMNAPTKHLLTLTIGGRIAHGGNPVLRYMADNMNVKTDGNERVQPMKNKSTGRIDGIVGIIMALDRLIGADEPELAEGGALIIDIDL